MLSDYLSTANILDTDLGDNKISAIEILSTKLANINSLKRPSSITKAILERETIGSTALPTGVAVPHARCTDVEKLHLVMGISQKGISEKFEGKNILIHVLFLFVSPANSKKGMEHLRLLAYIAKLFKDETLTGKLKKCTNSEEIIKLMKNFETSS